MITLLLHSFGLRLSLYDQTNLVPGLTVLSMLLMAPIFFVLFIAKKIENVWIFAKMH